MSDLISRQATIDLINDIDLINFTAKGIVRDRLRKLPSAQPERKKGQWIDAVISNDSGDLPVIVCDKCNTFFPLQFGASHNFCPNCGADMRGE